MKTIIKNTAVIVLILTLFASCSKYEDGPWISFVSANNRIVGEYYVEYFSINGVDITQQWTDSCDWKFKLYDDDETREVETILYYSGKLYKNGVWHNIDYYGGYSFNNDNKSVQFSMNGYYDHFDNTNYFDEVGLYPLSTGMTHEFVIKRLKYDELWISLSGISDEYLIRFKEL